MTIDDWSGRADRVFTDEMQLRAVFGEPNARVKAKVTDRIDPLAARFIAASPFAVLSTRRPDGGVDVTPRGDPPGFALVLDEKTLALPERPGNRRIDSLSNILGDPAVGLLFIIPGHGDTLRVSGRARIVQDAALAERMQVRSHRPEAIVLIAVERVLAHCPKAFVRSSLWRPEGWPDRSDVPSLAEMSIAHSGSPETVPEVEEIIARDGRERLY